MTDDDSATDPQDASTDQDLDALAISDPYKVLGAISKMDGVGVRGKNTTTSGAGRGVEGFTDATGDNLDAKPAGVYGEARATNSELLFPETYGVHGVTNAAGEAGTSLPAGVRGEGNGGGVELGVYGTTQGNAGEAAGVYGLADTSSEFSNANGVLGKTNGYDDGAAGVRGVATANSGKTYGVYGETNSKEGTSGSRPAGIYGLANTSGHGYAVHADGRSKVSGTLDVTDVGASVHMDYDQTINTSVETVQFDGVVQDDRNEWDLNGLWRFRCATDGDYRVDTTIRWGTTPSEGTSMTLRIMVNTGSFGSSGTAKAERVDRVGWSNASNYSMHLSKTLKNRSKDDEIYVEVEHGTSNDHAIKSGAEKSYLTITKVG